MAVDSINSRRGQQVFVGLLSVAIFIMLIQIAKTVRTQVDLSREQQFSVSSGLLDLLQLSAKKNLSIHITAFSAQQGRRDALARNQTVEDMLMQLSRHSDNLQWTMVDFDAERNIAMQMGVSSYGTLVVEVGDDRFDVPERNVFYKQIGGQGFQFVGEASLEDGLRQILFPNPLRAGVLSGVGGRNLYDTTPSGFSNLMKTFENNGYTIEKIPILETQNFSEDLDVLLVLEPQSALGMQVEQLLAEYFQGGGQLWFVSDLAPVVLPSIFQVQWSEGVVAEPSALFPYWDYPIIPSTRIEEVDGLMGDLSFVLQRGGALISESANDGIEHHGIVKLSSNGWLEVDEIGQQQAPKFTNGIDWKGSANMIMGLHNDGVRSILMRDVDWLQNSMIAEVPANLQLADALIKWLKQETQSDSAGRKLSEPMLITQPQLSKIRWSVLLPLPLIITGFGVLVWWRRDGK